jgi:hypothetical protein
VVPVNSKNALQGNQEDRIAKTFMGEQNRASNPKSLKKVKEITLVHDAVKDLAQQQVHESHVPPSEKRLAFEDPPWQS